MSSRAGKRQADNTITLRPYASSPNKYASISDRSSSTTITRTPLLATLVFYHRFYEFSKRHVLVQQDHELYRNCNHGVYAVLFLSVVLVRCAVNDNRYHQMVSSINLVLLRRLKLTLNQVWVNTTSALSATRWGPGPNRPTRWAFFWKLAKPVLLTLSDPWGRVLTLSDPRGGVLTLTNPQGGQSFLKTGRQPLVDKPLLSVTHGQCDARPTVTFPA